MNAPDMAAQTMFENLMNALEAKHYRDFIREGNLAFKIGINYLTFRLVAAQLSGRMQQGYEASYLGQLYQKRNQVYLWKLSFQDGGCEFLARLAVANGKASGILIT